MTADRLAAMDEAYLVAEEPSAPLHVASLGIFEGRGLCDARGRLRLRAIRARIASRLDLLPRLRQKVAPVPFDLNRPVWIDDVDFDIANHVDSVALGRPNDEAALVHLAEAVVMEPLDRSRPLWHLRFVTGLEGGRVALIERAHHAMVDGVSGVDVSLALLDLTPDAPDAAASPWEPEPPPSAQELLASGIADRLSAPLTATARALRSLLAPDALAHDVRGVAGALSELRHDGVRAPHCSLNRPVGDTRQLLFVREQLEAVRTAGAPHGATVNDVVLAAVTSGLRALFLERGEPIPSDRVVKALVPVSVRTDGESMALGNRVGGLVAPLPVGIGDPHERLRRISATMAALKASGEASTADQMLRAADLLPPSLAHLVARGLNHQPLVNMVVTNVPGPDFPLYAMGSRMLEAFPIVPLGGNMSLEVAVLSYDGALNVSVTADRDACPDAITFARGVEGGFAALHASWTPALT
ncbi:MAG: wax ester/triacylglycerol synthase family O-acyltransferase [Acidimicrobiales bacterium]